MDKKTAGKKKQFKPKVLAFTCLWCGVGKNETNPVEVFSDFKLIKLMCSGRINTALALQTFEKGADGIIVFGCPEGKCHYCIGNQNALEEKKTIKEMLTILGIKPERFKLALDDFREDNKFESEISKFVKEIRRLGPSPISITEKT
ncbi:MAG: hydrogenase iron-sulfur subunit [Candidatus Cloacimonadota bacterium]|jgi:coenzyme F420-reducing hydrogenase delta subunit|nr:MAG: hydrogenase iron-sulfur subunit [Candidatus Cloacimonadota bacterium]